MRKSEIERAAREVKAQVFGTKAILTRMSDVEPEAVAWLWPSRFPIGKISLLVGDPKLGKSFLTCALAAAVSRGAPWPDGSGNAPRGGVVMVNAEDGLADTIRPRLDAAGADCSRIIALEGAQITDDDGKQLERSFCFADLAPLEQAIEAVGDCKLVVIDPVTAYLGSADSHKNAEVRALLAPLKTLAEKHRCAVVLVSHLNKGQASAMYRTSGSLAFVALARAIWACVRDKDDPSRRMMLSIGCNLAADPGGLGYLIESNSVRWTGRVDCDADEALAAAKPEREGEQIAEAKHLLNVELSIGARPAKEILGAARQAGISERTLREAKSQLGVRSAKVAGSWTWQLRESQELSDDELDRMADAHAGGNDHAG